MTTDARLEYELTQTDFVTAGMDHYASDRIGRDMNKVMYLLVGVGFVSYSAWTTVRDPDVAWIWLLLGGLFLASAGGPARRWSVRRQLEKMARECVAQGVFGPTSVAIEDDGVRSTTNAGEGLLKWGALQVVRIRNDLIRIYFAPQAYLIVPAPSSDPDRIATKAILEELSSRGIPVATDPPAPDTVPGLFRRAVVGLVYGTVGFLLLSISLGFSVSRACLAEVDGCSPSENLVFDATLMGCLAWLILVLYLALTSRLPGARSRHSNSTAQETTS